MPPILDFCIYCLFMASLIGLKSQSVILSWGQKLLQSQLRIQSLQHQPLHSFPDTTRSLRHVLAPPDAASSFPTVQLPQTLPSFSRCGMVPQTYRGSLKHLPTSPPGQFLPKPFPDAPPGRLIPHYLPCSETYAPNSTFPGPGPRFHTQ